LPITCAFVSTSRHNRPLVFNPSGEKHEKVFTIKVLVSSRKPEFFSSLKYPYPPYGTALEISRGLRGWWLQMS